MSIRLKPAGVVLYYVVNLTIIFVGFGLIRKMFMPSPHHCRYIECPFQYDRYFEPSHSSEYPGTHSYRLDSLHFEQPELDYDQLETTLNEPDNTHVI